jgi:hypothetical protein
MPPRESSKSLKILSDRSPWRRVYVDAGRAVVSEDVLQRRLRQAPSGIADPFNRRRPDGSETLAVEATVVAAVPAHGRRTHLTPRRLEERRDALRGQAVIRRVGNEPLPQQPSCSGFGGHPDVASQIGRDPPGVETEQRSFDPQIACGGE